MSSRNAEYGKQDTSLERGLFDVDDAICPGCSSDRVGYLGPIAPCNTFAGRVLDREIRGGGLFRCRHCQLVFRYPRMAKLELDRLYRQGNVEGWSTPEMERTDWLMVKDWLATQKGAQRILDVGCFDGRFLEFLGDRYDKMGIEIHAGAAERARARGIDVVGDDFFHFPALNVGVDVALALDVIEHADDPKDLLVSLASCVRPGGFVVLTTGNSDAPSWRLMGSRYWYCHIAEHLSFINPAWAEWIAPRLGLEIEHLRLFSHAEGRASVKQRVYETFANLVLRFAPKLFALLRRFGAGGIDLDRYPGLVYAPPCWMSAKDHMLVVFKKR